MVLRPTWSFSGKVLKKSSIFTRSILLALEMTRLETHLYGKFLEFLRSTKALTGKRTRDRLLYGAGEPLDRAGFE
jgi:hypothetical protein